MKAALPVTGAENAGLLAKKRPLILPGRIGPGHPG